MALNSPHVLDLGRGVRFEIHKAERAVCTVYPGGERVWGCRDDTPENRREAEWQGYSGPDAVFLSLAEHEALHVLLERVTGRPSPVMTGIAGLSWTPAWEKNADEVLTLFAQRMVNVGRGA